MIRVRRLLRAFSISAYPVCSASRYPCPAAISLVTKCKLSSALVSFICALIKWFCHRLCSEGLYYHCSNKKGNDWVFPSVPQSSSLPRHGPFHTDWVRNGSRLGYRGCAPVKNVWTCLPLLMQMWDTFTLTSHLVGGNRKRSKQSTNADKNR